MWDPYYILLFVYTFCMNFVDKLYINIIFMTYTFCRSELMYTNCIQIVCIQNVSHISTNLHTLCIQNLAAITLLILYTKCMKCQNVVYNLYEFCIYQLYTSCTIFVYKMFTQFPCGKLKDARKKLIQRKIQELYICILFLLHKK